jgi:hypothetical protein
MDSGQTGNSTNSKRNKSKPPPEKEGIAPKIAEEYFGHPLDRKK